MALFAYYVVFNLMKKDYDASVISAGFIGFGLGATPVGIANMRAITGKYGASPKAFIVVPLIGAFFLDLLNAVIIQIYLAFPAFG
jgi:ESS family glutamate:Na+ symporter